MLSACGGSDDPDDAGAETSGAETSTAEDPPASAPSEPVAGSDDESTGGESPVDEDDGDQAGPADTTGVELFPDVIDATATYDGETWTIAATLSSPYDSPERYADAWRVVGPDGTIYGERILTHDHASEQPFTRSQSGIEIPAEVAEVTIEGRDQISGYGGQTVLLFLTS